MTVTNIDELEKCKEFCIKNGYCNFSVHAGKAYIRNNTIEHLPCIIKSDVERFEDKEYLRVTIRWT